VSVGGEESQVVAAGYGVPVVDSVVVGLARRCGVPPGVLAGACLCTGEHCSRWMQIAVAVWLEPSWTAYGCGASKQMATLGVSR